VSPAPRRPLAACLLATLAAALIAACGGSDQAPVTVADAPSADSHTSAPVAAGPLPVTRNTSRIDGSDPVADAAEVALATHPRFPGASPIDSVALVASANWQGAVAASSLAGDPLRIPILFGQQGSLPDPTSQALDTLDPQGGKAPNDSAVYAIGDVEAPSGLRTTKVAGDSPAALAANIDELRGKLTGADPANVVLVSDEHPAFAMPAAAWAARSGDPVLFVSRDSVPPETLEALKRHTSASVYLLGPPSSASDKTLREVQRVAANTIRISGDDPVTNAIEFARYTNGGFGWNINDPGHGLVLANGDRPGDAGAASALSASGSYGPLLITDSATQLPDALRSFLREIQPGYTDDPTRAIYNHVWLIGDSNAISGGMQAEIDDLTELAPIGGSATTPTQAVPVAPSTDNETPPPSAKGKAK
jgi:hypothetical protein